MPAMEKVLISACLLGEPVRYHGGASTLDHPILRHWQREGRLVPICPEVAGGLSIPRPPAELVQLGEQMRIVTSEGIDVTAAFEAGSRWAAETCAASGARVAILKDDSPSCGSHFIFDGTFTGRRTAGEGVTARRLRAAGVKVFSEHEVDAAADYLERLESGS
jgi:uncharacterized protein YbbK (DUF523 family)